MNAIDLSLLPAPNIVEPLSYEEIVKRRKARLIARFPEDEREAVARTLELESEPMTKLLQASAYEEFHLRQRINEAAVASMVAFAMGSDLDHWGANLHTQRLVISPAIDSTLPPTPAVMESDSDFRKRIPQAFEGLSVAGPTAAYEFHALSADGRVADACATSPTPAVVLLSVLSREGSGFADADLLAVVEKALNHRDIRPVGDRLLVQSVDIIDYTIDATLFIYPGPEAEPIRKAAEETLEAYINEQRRIGRDIRLSAIYAALHVEGIQRVELAAPVADVVIHEHQAAYCTNYSIVVGGYDV